MKVSVIVPMYNAAPYVGAALDSILAQTRPVDEIIVVDDGSTDAGPAIVARYASPVRLLRQDHAGTTTALNRGLRAASGAALAFLDADDVWMPGKQAVSCAALEAETTLDGVFGHVVQFLSADAQGAAGRYVIPEGAMPGMIRGTLLMRREAFDRFGWFDETLSTADFVPWFARANGMGFRHRMLDDVLMQRRLHLTNTGVLRRHDQQQENLLGLRQALALRRGRRGGT